MNREKKKKKRKKKNQTILSVGGVNRSSNRSSAVLLSFRNDIVTILYLTYMRVTNRTSF